MTRRMLLRGAGTVAGTLCLAAMAKPGLAALPARMGRRGKLRVAVDLVRAALADHRGAARLGAAYLRSAPEEFDVERVLTALELQIPELAGLTDAQGPEHVKSAFSRQVVVDFENDAVVELDGWILSRTEIRLAALAHMLRDRLTIV